MHATAAGFTRFNFSKLPVTEFSPLSTDRKSKILLPAIVNLKSKTLSHIVRKVHAVLRIDFSEK